MQRPNSWKTLPPTDTNLVSALTEWFVSFGRSFPWRTCTDPYHILCVEVMLQRTRANQVVPVFTWFTERFSTPQEFVEAGEAESKSIFRRLGLRWRAEQFWRLNTELAEQGCEVPSDRKALKSLPGVGDYVADAVRLFGFGYPTTLIDSNVLRVLGRYYGIEFADHARRSNRVLSWAAEHAPSESEAAKSFNWSLIDLGALVCKPRIPNCPECPLRNRCWHAANAADTP